jgi:hypothetical protein
MAIVTRASIDIGFVPPNEPAKQALSEGFYSLSSRSNVPYVSLTGASGFFKIFTWGEIVEIPCGQTCTVKNESFHGGDIYINCGIDNLNRPARITVPVPMQFTPDGGPDTGLFRPLYPADVRLARRAYFVMQLLTVDPPANLFRMIIKGKRFDGSHNTPNALQVFLEPGAGYGYELEYPLSTAIGPVPLGYLSAAGDDSRPHTLLTTATVEFANFSIQGESASLLGIPTYYTMEY